MKNFLWYGTVYSIVVSISIVSAMLIKLMIGDLVEPVKVQTTLEEDKLWLEKSSKIKVSDLLRRGFVFIVEAEGGEHTKYGDSETETYSKSSNGKILTVVIYNDGGSWRMGEVNSIVSSEERK